jgi:hypothetical protein
MRLPEGKEYSQEEGAAYPVTRRCGWMIARKPRA